MNLWILRDGRMKNKQLICLREEMFKQLGSLCRLTAFTLAEMMVVMLIMTIVLAAMAPVITTRMNRQNGAVQSGGSSIWQWVSGNTHAYFGDGNAQMALIGTDTVTDADSAKLIINRVDGGPINHIEFKDGGATNARLLVTEDSILLNGGSASGPKLTALGIGALFSNTDGIVNTAVGHNALYLNTTGSDNTAVGHSALERNTTGEMNTAIGYKALSTLMTGSYNIGLGAEASMSTRYGNHNIAIGNATLQANINGSHNIALGYKALNDNSTSDSDIAEHNIAIGNEALSKNRGNGNIAIGNKALANESSRITGSNNIAIGIETLKTNTTGEYNIAIGYQADAKSEDVLYGIAIGSQAEIGRGDESLSEDNVAPIAIGASAQAYYNDIAIGLRALGLQTERTGWNIAIGTDAMGQVDNEHAMNNIAIGGNTLQSVHQGNNTAIGHNACQFVKGKNKTCIGYNSGPADGHTWAGKDDAIERIFIGSTPSFTKSGVDIVAPLEIHNIAHSSTTETTTVVINGNLLVRGIAEIQTGISSNNLVAGIKTYNGYVNFSDARLKNIGSEITSGLDKIKQLKVFNYTFKDDKEKTPRVGVIAQDLQKVFPDAVTKGQDGYLRIRMEDMFYAMDNAIKELDAQITKMASEILKQVQDDVNKKFAIRDEAIKRVQDDNARLKQENKDLKEALKQVQKDMTKIQNDAIKAERDKKNLEKRLQALEMKLK